MTAIKEGYYMWAVTLKRYAQFLAHLFKAG